jgi:hypothetical protein
MHFIASKSWKRAVYKTSVQVGAAGEPRSCRETKDMRAWDVQDLVSQQAHRMPRYLALFVVQRPVYASSRDRSITGDSCAGYMQQARLGTVRLEDPLEDEGQTCVPLAMILAFQ